MNRTIHDVAPSPLRTLYWPVEQEMARVEQLLREQMRNRHAFVDELVRYGCLLGGKRLRPALLLLIAKSVGAVRQEHLVLAAVVEMIHTATLVHDDVLDEADMRRHLATVNARWDNESSVLLGDYLFTHAFYLASTLESTQACRLIGKATNLVCEGEIRQKGSRANYQLTEAEYLSIISAKTAELCACCGELGALFAGGDAATVEAMAQFGRKLGVAFQIADDLLDVQGDEQATGKSLGTDLEKQKPTLPLIRAMQVASPAARDALLAALEEPASGRRLLLTNLLEELGAIEYTRQTALGFAQEARELLADRLAPSPSRQVLELMTDLVVNRSH